MADDPPTIRAMTLDDVDPAADVLVGGGWGDRRAFFRFAVGHDRCWPFVAEVDGRLSGTGIATANGSVGWVGMIFVDEGLRGRGLGTSLTGAVIDRLEAEGCTTLALLASPLGRPIYERLGFTAETEYRLLVTHGGGGAPDEATGGDPEGHPSDLESLLRPYRPGDLPAIAALDWAASGEDREHLLRVVVGPASTTVAVRPDGRIVGFDIAVPWGTHPTIAPELVDGVQLLQARRARGAAGSDVRTAIPDVNREGLTALENLGWRDERGLTRMVRGAPLTWLPKAIWGQFNYAIG
jgi:GNAT superfamily N-acetyltransferase